MAIHELEPIRVTPAGRYFETSSGKPFLFIGANDALSWPGLAGLYQNQDRGSVERYLADYAANGATILRLMLEYAHEDRFYFETTPGTPNLAIVEMWDTLFEICAELGLRVLLTPWDTFWLDRRWHAHPYNCANGGPCVRPEEFLSNPQMINFMEQRFRFVIERWGGNGVLAAWDLFNEFHPYWGGTPDEQAALITHLSEYIRDHEERCWGFTRPQTVSSFGPAPEQALAEIIFRHPMLDFATTHIYHRDAIDYPRDTVAPALCMAQWVRYGLEQTPANRPFTDSEHGPIHLFNDQERWLPEDFDTEYERHMMWAHLASGGAGSGMRWPSRHPHVLLPGMKQALGNLRQALPLLDWRHFKPRPIDTVLKLDRLDFVALGSYDSRQAIVWLLRNDTLRHVDQCLPAPIEQAVVQFELRDLEPTHYAVHRWDTLHGIVGSTQTILVTEDRCLTVSIPDVGNDLAIFITPTL